VDPRTLTRAARDFAAEKPDFALEAGALALEALVQGCGYEVTGADVWQAHFSTIKALKREGLQPRSATASGRLSRCVNAHLMIVHRLRLFEGGFFDQGCPAARSVFAND